MPLKHYFGLELPVLPFIFSKQPVDIVPWFCNETIPPCLRLSSRFIVYHAQIDTMMTDQKIMIWNLHANACKDAKDAAEQRCINRNRLGNLQFISQFAAASHWPDNNNSTGDLLRCPGDGCPKVQAGNCPHLEKGEYTTVSEWEDMADLSDTDLSPEKRHGFIMNAPGSVALSHPGELSILAFRSSESHHIWAEDFKTD